MKVFETGIKGLVLIEPLVFRDNRGFFLETYSLKKFQEAGINCTFVQDNHSRSEETGVLRGLHFQLPPFTQSKLIRVTRGSIFDVVVDLRKNSDTYGKWLGFELNENNFKMLFIPQGFAHGFCTLEKGTEVQYKVDKFYAPESDSGIRWDDPALKIKWPVNSPVISKKDALLPLFNQIEYPF